MKNKIQVEICCGTACYLLGATELIDIEDTLPEDCRGRVEINARTCLELCERDNLGGAPYVRFYGSEIMPQATPEKVMTRILELVEGIA
jgi:NADH:ubiquinone oxidoreductase subunit E